MRRLGNYLVGPITYPVAVAMGGLVLVLGLTIGEFWPAAFTAFVVLVACCAGVPRNRSSVPVQPEPS